MGGGSDVESAFAQHLEWAGGGDYLVIRASGTDAYNSWIRELGPSNSVATLLTKSRRAAEDPFVLSKIDAADALWFAGGDQGKYLEEWQNTTMQRRLQAALSDRHVPVGGTSAGCDVQSGAIYTGENGSVESDEALGDPYDSRVTVQSFPFLKHTEPAGLLANLIVDTHFITRDRMGRLLTFAARLWKDDGLRFAAVGIDEKTALTIDAHGRATMHRQGSSGGRAFVLTPTTAPERCSSGEALAWSDVPVQKLDAAYNDTYDFVAMSGGSSQRYTISAARGTLAPQDPYSPPHANRSRPAPVQPTKPWPSVHEEAPSPIGGSARSPAPPMCSWCEGGACNPTCDVVKEHLNVSITPLTGRTFPYWRAPDASPLGIRDDAITIGVLVHHGTARNGDDYFCSMYNGLRKRSGASLREVMVIAPQIYEPADGPASTELYWDATSQAERNWKWGGNSSATLPASLSSFGAIDEILAVLMDRRLYPNLRTLVVAGHSAGGQVVQRYAMASSLEPPAGLAVAYFPANPSSYTYLDERRPVLDAPWTCDGFCDNATIAASTYAFATPQGTCPSYNRYGYGLVGTLPSYLAARGVDAMRAAYARRNVTYLSGSSDVCDQPWQTKHVCTPGCDPDDGGLDTSCEAMAQGHCRMMRAHAYAQYVHQFYAGTPIAHRLVAIPGVGHNGCAVFQSDEGLEAMFPADAWPLA